MYARRAAGALAAALLAVLLGAVSVPQLQWRTVAEVEIVVDHGGDYRDANPDDGECVSEEVEMCTLRAAIMHANGLPAEDVITIRIPSEVDRVVLDLAGGFDDDALEGDLDILRDMTIVGEPGVEIDGGGIDRIFDVIGGEIPVTLRLEDLTLVGGDTTEFGGGGAIRNGGDLFLTRVQVGTEERGNVSGGPGGGGLDNLGHAEIYESSFVGNSATGQLGGAIFNDTTGTVHVENTTIAANLATAGGGLALQGSASLFHVTLADNVAETGEANSVLVEGGSVNVVHSIVTAAGENCAGGFDEASSANLVSRSDDGWIVDESCGPGDLNGLDPVFGERGPIGESATHVQTISSESPAVDAGATEGCPATDQRGVTRPQGDACDLGAFEVEQEAPPAETVAVVTNTGDASGDCLPGDCSLRQAIEAANNPDLAIDTIHFAIPGEGVQTISPASPLPTITSPVTIDGYTQPGTEENASDLVFAGTLQIVLSGPDVPFDGPSAGLTLNTSDSVIRGLVINGGFDYGIWISGGLSNRNVIAGNFIGTTDDGEGPRGLGTAGIYITDSAANTVIGGTNPADRNVISGTAGLIGAGIRLEGSVETEVVNNLIGTQADGDGAVPNWRGIFILDSSSNLIYGRNVISGNTEDGIHVETSPEPPVGVSSRFNEITGNLIGTDAAGAAALGNGGDGINIVGADDNTVGGPGDGDGNVVADSTGHGIFLLESTGALVEGNYSGTNAAGTAALGNTIDGIAVQGGGNHTIRGNLTSGNTNQGIAIFRLESGTFPSGIVVQGNKAGTTAAGTGSIPNGGHGILMGRANTTTVGGILDGQGNHVAFNTGIGIAVAAEGTGNTIRGNSVEQNGELGIDLVPEGGPNGVTPNDGFDGDTGPNNLQNFPDLTSAALDGEGNAIVSGELDVRFGPGTYTIDFYASAACDPSGHGEGTRYLGSDQVEVDRDDVGPVPTFTSPGIGPVDAGDVITATLTDSLGNTSEFSNCVTASTTEVSEITLEADAASVEAGVSRVALSDIPAATAFGLATGQTQATPLANIPLANIPLANIDLARSPLANIPLANIGFGDATVLAGPLGDITLSALPITYPGGWAAVLVGTPLANLPLQTVTLRMVYELPILPPPLQPGNPTALTLGQMDLSTGQTGSIPLAAIGLGATPLANIPLANISTTLADWCAALAGPPINCTDPASLAAETALGATLRGAPLANIPLANIPLANIPLANIPLANIPLANIPLANTPLANIPLANIPLANTPLANIPLANIPLANIGLVVDCTVVDCATATLGDAAAAGALVAGAELADLGFYGDVTIGDIGHYAEITLLDLLAALVAPDPAPVTLEDLWLLAGESATLGHILLLFLDPTDAPWETVPFATLDLQRHATDREVLVYGADFSLDGSAPTDVVLRVAIPDGFLYLGGSARLLPGEGAQLPLSEADVTGPELRFTAAALASPGSYRLELDVVSGMTLGTASAKAFAAPAGGSETESNSELVQVTDTFEPNDTPATAAPIDGEHLYLSYVTSDDDVDYYKLQIPSELGTRVTFRLSHLPADLDLVVYGPERLEPPRAAPAGPPLDGLPLADHPRRLDAFSRQLGPEALEDVPIVRSLPLWGLSINRGTADEDVVVISDGEEGDYIVQVSGYNGASSAEPYMLRAQVSPPRELPECQPRTFPHSGGAAGSAPTLPAQLDTVFLVHTQRLRATFGAAAADSALQTLQSNLGALSTLGFPSAIVPVEAYGPVAAAYGEWDDDPCSPHRANAVVRAITDVLDDIRTGRPSLKHVVLVGADDIVPQARIDDVTSFANELEYAGTFGTVNSQYLGSFGNGKLLIDAPYGTIEPIPFFNRELYVQELAVGRLVETPAEIAAAVTTFVSFGGRLEPETALTMGYDFLSDGAAEIHDHLSQLVGTAELRADDDWTKDDVLARLGSSAPDVLSVNAHYDHHRGLPADQNAQGTESQLFTTEDVRLHPAQSMAGRLLFTMGCHAGLSLSDVVIGTSPEDDDWAQAFAGRGALFAGNTGFGLGDTEVVAYTEKLLALFSEELGNASSIGEALDRAKHRYLALQGVVGVYDEKVMSQMTLYGLPMYAVGPATAQAAAAASTAATAVEPDPVTGIDATTFDVARTPAQFTKVDGPRGSYYEVEGGDLQVTHFRPIQPRLQLPAQDDAHGALVTELESVDEGNFDPVFSRPTVDLAEREPEISFGDVAFPTKIQTVTRGPDGDSVVLVLGQFFTTGTPPTGLGVQRLFTGVTGLVYSSSSDDYVPPEFRRIDGLRLGSLVSFAVDVSDPEPAGGSVERVYVLYRDDAGWHGVDLAPQSGGSWTGGGPLTGTDVEFFVQAVDGAGNVAVSTRKGRYFEAAPPPPPPAAGGIEVLLNGNPPSATPVWHTAPVQVTLAGADGLEYSVDGGAFVSYTGAFQIAADGIHRVDVRGAGGESASVVVLIDRTAPTVVLATPANGGSYTLGSSVAASYVCLDSGSGIASCTGTVANGQPIDTTSIGTKSFSVTATDAVGKTTTVSHTYKVVFEFEGFFQPIENPPVVNVVKAGQSVPVRFSLNGNQGLNIFAPGYPKPVSVKCDSGSPSDDLEDTVNPGGSGLTYDAVTDQYTYVWKTDKKWANTCRDLVLRFVDGTERTARFRFKR